jgi:hypothetical protein
MPQEKFLDDAGLLHLIAALKAQGVEYSPPTSGAFAGYSLTQFAQALSEICAGTRTVTAIQANVFRSPPT